MTWDPHALAHRLVDSPARIMAHLHPQFKQKATKSGAFTEEQAAAIADMVIEVAVSTSSLAIVSVVGALAEITPENKMRCMQLLIELGYVLDALNAQYGVKLPDPKDN